MDFVNVDPTPEEIRVLTAEIRRGWDARTERNRRAYDYLPVTIPVVSSHLGRDRMEQERD